MPAEHRSVTAIDETRLDQEWLTQDQKVTKYGELEAQARADHSHAKAQVELIEAEVMIEARNTPIQYGLPDKPAVDLLKAAAIKSKRFQKAQSEMIEAKRLLDLYSVAMSALEHRKKALENLVVLHGRDFYSSPKPKDRDSREFAENATRKNVRKGIK